MGPVGRHESREERKQLVRPLEWLRLPYAAVSACLLCRNTVVRHRRRHVPSNWWSETFADEKRRACHASDHSTNRTEASRPPSQSGSFSTAPPRRSIRSCAVRARRRNAGSGWHERGYGAHACRLARWRRSDALFPRRYAVHQSTDCLNGLKYATRKIKPPESGGLSLTPPSGTKSASVWKRQPVYEMFGFIISGTHSVGAFERPESVWRTGGI
jgi:hypothetical protein